MQLQIINQRLDFPSKNLHLIIEHITGHGGKARVVGGAVRDVMFMQLRGAILDSRLRGNDGKEGGNDGKEDGNDGKLDIDIATDLLPQEVINLFELKGINTLPTGIKFGTVSVFIEDEVFEVTTLRCDLESDGRHAKVSFSKDFKEDASRRDFTINALSYDPLEEKIYDYFGGLEDLKNHKVRFIGNPTARITEDYLRILRFFRFSARYAKIIDNEALAACLDLKENLNKLSKERIKSEMDKILSLSNASFEILDLMFQKGILQEILPVKNYDIARIKKAAEFAKNIDSNLVLDTHYAMMVDGGDVIKVRGVIKVRDVIPAKAGIQGSPDDVALDDVNGDIPHILHYLKFSRASIRQITSLLALELQVQEIDFLLHKIWYKEKNFDQYCIFIASLLQEVSHVKDIYLSLSKRSKPKFPINGSDMLALSLKGAEIKQKLSFLEDVWIKSDFMASKEDLLASAGLR